MDEHSGDREIRFYDIANIYKSGSQRRMDVRQRSTIVINYSAHAVVMLGREETGESHRPVYFANDRIHYRRHRIEYLVVQSSREREREKKTQTRVRCTAACFCLFTMAIHQHGTNERQPCSAADEQRK